MINTKNRTFLILMTAIMTAGIIAGSFTAVFCDFLKASPLAGQYIYPLLSGITLLEIFKNTFLSVSALLGVIFCTGFFAVGQPLSVAMLIYRGFGIGFSSALTYMAFGKSGVYISLIFIAPKILATSVIIMLAVRESLRLSNIIYGYIFREACQENMGKYIKLYCIKFIVLILFVLLTALADCGINYLFGYML